MSPKPYDSRAKAPPAKRSEKGYGDENECPSQRGHKAHPVPSRDESDYMLHGVVAFASF